MAVPKSIRQWSLTTLRDKLIKIGAKVTRHSKYVTFQLAEVAVTRRLFAAILARIEQLAIPPPLVARADAEHDLTARSRWESGENTPASRRKSLPPCGGMAPALETTETTHRGHQSRPALDAPGGDATMVTTMNLDRLQVRRKREMSVG